MSSKSKTTKKEKKSLKKQATKGGKKVTWKSAAPQKLSKEKDSSPKELSSKANLIKSQVIDLIKQGPPSYEWTLSDEETKELVSTLHNEFKVDDHN